MNVWNAKPMKSVKGTEKTLDIIAHLLSIFGPRCDDSCLHSVMFKLAHPSWVFATGFSTMDADRGGFKRKYFLTQEGREAQTRYDVIGDLLIKKEISIAQTKKLLRPLVVGKQYQTSPRLDPFSKGEGAHSKRTSSGPGRIEVCSRAKRSDNLGSARKNKLYQTVKKQVFAELELT